MTTAAAPCAARAALRVPTPEYHNLKDVYG